MQGSISDGITKLFVGGIQPTCKESDIRQSLSVYSQDILKVDIKMKNNFLNRGYAFIFVSSPKVADRMTKMKFKLKDRILQIQNVNKNSSEKEEYKMKRLYLKNLPPKTSDSELLKFFERFGEVRSSYIIKDRLGQNRDYGFIDFEHVEDVDTCLEALKKSSFVLRGNKIKVRRFIKLDEKNENMPETDAGSAKLNDERLNAQRTIEMDLSTLVLPQADALGSQHWYNNSLDQREFRTSANPEFGAVLSYTGLVLPAGHLSSSSSKKRVGNQRSTQPLLNVPTCYPAAQVASPFLMREIVGQKEHSDDSLSKGHPAYPFDQTYGIKKERSQEFEVDYDFLIKRDHFSYKSDIELNHYFTNLRLKLRPVQSSGRVGQQGRPLLQTN